MLITTNMAMMQNFEVVPAQI